VFHAFLPLAFAPGLELALEKIALVNEISDEVALTVGCIFGLLDTFLRGPTTKSSMFEEVVEVLSPFPGHVLEADVIAGDAPPQLDLEVLAKSRLIPKLDVAPTSETTIVTAVGATVECTTV